MHVDTAFHLHVRMSIYCKLWFTQRYDKLIFNLTAKRYLWKYVIAVKGRTPTSLIIACNAYIPVASLLMTPVIPNQWKAIHDHIVCKTYSHVTQTQYNKLSLWQMPGYMASIIHIHILGVKGFWYAQKYYPVCFDNLEPNRWLSLIRTHVANKLLLLTRITMNISFVPNH